ncbi:hypothetical protein PGT21_020569 [Puccinia graminis f. sp. tritici]|uniref:Uncharacterized protein n=1 Tax=Puccinia graminis f. sp. tritici TaxID=56615 RepID=A0A5B0M5R2_PUCGR|nr:hypothetical protein PGTUg99_004825 [Puccinia graminis f. sp. tritici]KAA1094416.1 hypothetical protein PGT21_020569 [Puccinia graminis f. sp. tritici]
MHSFKGKMRGKEADDSDSDESFHCCGRPEDLLADAQSLMEELSDPDASEVHVPDDQNYYLYSAGLERMNSPNNKSSKRQSASSIHEFRRDRSSTVYSSDSECTRIGSPLLIIKTGELAPPSPLSDMSQLQLQLIEPTTTQPKRKPRWKIQIPRAQSFIRMAVSPNDDYPQSPELPSPTPQASDSPPPTKLAQRRRGRIFNTDNLPEELKKLARSPHSDGSAT